jgi:hypothetical protein
MTEAERLARDVEMWCANFASADEFWRARELVRAVVRDSYATGARRFSPAELPVYPEAPGLVG